MAPKSKTTKQKQPAKSTAPIQHPAPNWPPMNPVLPADSLSLETVLPNQIVTISNLWTSTLCAKYVSFLRSLPLATTPGIPKKGDAVRVNDRFQIEDPVFAERLWSETGLKDLIVGTEDPKLWGGEVLGLNANIRIYRYSKGQFFDQHCKSLWNVVVAVNSMLTLSQTMTQTTSPSHLPLQPTPCQRRRRGLCSSISLRQSRVARVARRSFTLTRPVGAKHRLPL